MTHGEVRRHELSDFLRTRRTRISPADIGIPTAHRRRTPGLRRKEVAQLAGMSATWYTWLEQRRAISESPGMLENLARVLQLNPVKRTQLFRLARREPVIDSAAARNGQTSRGKARQRSVPSRPHARISSPSPKCTEVERLDGGERERFEPSVPRELRALQKMPKNGVYSAVLDCHQLSGEDRRLLFGTILDRDDRRQSL
jgi:transcriptional regulator with XRE-family HTH domain